MRKKLSMPSNYKIKQIQVGSKCQIDILRSLRKMCFPLEKWKNASFLKVSDTLSKLGGLPIIKNSTLLSTNDLDSKVLNLKEKWDREFENLSYFSKILELGPLVMWI